MSAASPFLDPNATRAQLRLVVLGQWVRAGLSRARGARTGRSLLGGVIALWQVVQAVRLAIALIHRLSELRDALSSSGLVRATGATTEQQLAEWSDDPPTAACLRHALSEIAETLRDALGLAPEGVRPSRAARPVGATAARTRPRPLGRLTPAPRGRPPDRPPGLVRWRSPFASRALDAALPLIATLAFGR